LRGQPAPVADLDGVGAVPPREQAQHVALEKRGIHAEFERHAAAQAPADALDHIAQEGRRLLGVVDVPRPVLEPQDVAGLRDVRQQRVVTAVFPMMRIEAAKGPGDRRAGADHGAVDIDGEARHLEPRQRVEHDLPIQLNEGPQRLLREASQPVADRARRGQPGESGEATDEGIADEILHMLQSTRPDVEEREEQQSEPRAAVVATEPGTRGVQAARKLEAAHVPPHQFEATVRGELLRDERDRQIPLDHLPQRLYAQAHQRGLRESKSDMGMSALLIRREAPLMHFSGRSIPVLFSDWG
jgi:hypothetical protein